jgi:hypothetical protein
LFDYIHHALLNSLQEKQDLVHKEALQHSWDQFSDLLCRVDAATACHGWITQNHFVTFLFDIWKVSSQFTIPVTLSTITYTFRILEISRWPHKNRKYLRDPIGTAPIRPPRVAKGIPNTCWSEVVSFSTLEPWRVQTNCQEPPPLYHISSFLTTVF